MKWPINLTSHESALRKLPLPYSLALRLRAAPGDLVVEVVSEYVGVDEQRRAEKTASPRPKLSAAEERPKMRDAS